MRNVPEDIFQSVIHEDSFKPQLREQYSHQGKGFFFFSYECQSSSRGTDAVIHSEMGVLNDFLTIHGILKGSADKHFWKGNPLHKIFTRLPFKPYHITIIGVSVLLSWSHRVTCKITSFIWDMSLILYPFLIVIIVDSTLNLQALVLKVRSVKYNCMFFFVLFFSAVEITTFIQVTFAIELLVISL